MVTAAAAAAIFGFEAGGLAAAIAAQIINLAISSLLGKILAPSTNDSRNNKGIQQLIRDPIAPRRIIYGEAIVGGPFVLVETLGADNEILSFINVISGHPIEDVLGVFLEETYVNIKGNATVGGYTNPDNNDLNAEYLVDKDPYLPEYKIRILKNLGWGAASHSYVLDHTATEVVNDQWRAFHVLQHLQNTDWQPMQPGAPRDSDTGLYYVGQDKDKLTNLANVFFSVHHNPEVFRAFPKLRYHVKGKRLYNPYKDPSLAQYGADSSGTHDLNNPDTWEWSEDWTLCVLDYLINKEYGLGVKADTSDPLNAAVNEIDWKEAIDSYLVSSQPISNGLPSGHYLYGTDPRYTVNGVFEVDATPISIMESLLASGAGELVYSQGMYKIRPGIYRAPNSENDIITEDMIVSPLTIQTHTPRKDLYNKASGVFLDAGYNKDQPITDINIPLFISADFEIVDPLDSTGTNPYEVIDGEEIIRNFDFPFTTRNYEAQRLARIQLERARRGLTVQFDATLDVLKYSVGDTIYLEILSDSKYAGEAFFNRLGLDDAVQNRPTTPFDKYYKQFKILTMEYNENFTISMTIIEEAEEIYDWNDGYASPDTNKLISEVIIDDPLGPVLPPSFQVTTPNNTIEEVFTGTGIRTQIYWTAPERASPTVNAVDRAHIERYELQFGVVTNPGESLSANRVSTWISAGYFTPNDRTSLIQGPISIDNLYIDDTTVYDFRLKGITFSGRSSPWAYYNEDIGSDYTSSAPATANRYYIRPANGTAIQNNEGELTLEARIVTGSGDDLLTSGNIKLYEYDSPYNELTVANNYQTGSDGYTGILDSTNINGNKTIKLADAPTGGTIYDTITVVDVADGADGSDSVVGYLDSWEGHRAWVMLQDGSSDPSDPYITLEATFVKNGVAVARTANRVQFGGIGGFLTNLGEITWSGSLNTDRISITYYSGFLSPTASIQFTYSNGPDYAVTAETIFVVPPGEARDRYYILPTQGTAIQNGTGEIVLESRIVTGGPDGSDDLLTSGNIKLYEYYSPNNELTVANNYQTGSDGYTGILDSTNINGKKIIKLADAPTGGTIYDTITVVDVIDGVDGISGFVTSSDGYSWHRADSGSSWTPLTEYKDLTVTFVRRGVELAVRTYRLNLNTTTGTIDTGAYQADSSDLNTSRITATPTGLGTATVSVDFTYSYVEDTASVSENIFTVTGGSPGADAITVTIDPDYFNWVVVHSGELQTGELTRRTVGNFIVFDGETDVTVSSNTSYSIVSPGGGLQDNLQLYLNSTTGEIELESVSPEWDADTSVFTLRATYNSVNYDRTFIARKLFKGPKPIQGTLTSETITVPADADGSNYILPTNPVSIFQISDDGVDITGDSSVTYGVRSPDTVDGLTIDINNLGEVGLSDSGAGWSNSSTSVSFTLYADIGTETVEKVYTITKALGGTTGDTSVSLSIYSDATTGSAPTIPSGSTYNFVTSTLTINDANWNVSPPSLTGDGDIVYVVTATITAAPTETAAAITWSTPATIYSRREDGKVGWSHNLTFSTTSPSDSTVAWSSGTVYTVGNPSGYAVSAGNTGSMAARTYIYLDVDLSGPPYTLQTTTTASNTVGANKILIAVAEDAANTNSEAFFQVFGGAGGLKIAADEIAANSINANNIQSGNFTGVTFTGATFETRARDTSGSPTRAVMQDSASGLPAFALQAYDSSEGGDVDLFSVAYNEGVAQVNIVGDLTASINSQIFSTEGLDLLRGELGVILPQSPTGGIASTNIPKLVSSGSWYSLYVDPYSATQPYIYGGNTNTITWTFRDYAYSGGPYTDPYWTIRFEYSENGSTGWTLAATWDIQGYGGVIYEDTTPPTPVYFLELNETRTTTFDPSISPGNTVYYRVRATLTAGSSVTPRFTTLKVSEPIEGGIAAHTHTENEVLVSTNNIVLGRVTAGAGGAEELTGTQVTALLDTFSTSSTTKGLVPGSSGAGATSYLDGTGNWSTPSTGSDNYVDSISFNTGNGVLTLGRTGALADLTQDLDGRYLTSYTETDTLNSVLGRGNSSATEIVITAVGNNTAPGTDDIRVSGYGIMGNRATFYISNTGGGVALGYGAVHSGATKLATTDTGVSITGNIVVSGTVDGVDIAAHVGGNSHIDWTTDQGATNIDVGNVQAPGSDGDLIYNNGGNTFAGCGSLSYNDSNPIGSAQVFSMNPPTGTTRVTGGQVLLLRDVNTGDTGEVLYLQNTGTNGMTCLYIDAPNGEAIEINQGGVILDSAQTGWSSLRIPTATATPTSPAAGDIWNDSGTPKWQAGGVTHSLPPMQFKHKTGPTARTDTTVSDDPHLFGFSIEPNVYYAVEYFFMLTAWGTSGAADFKFTWQFSGTPGSTRQAAIRVGTISGSTDVLTHTDTSVTDTSGGTGGSITAYGNAVTASLMTSTEILDVIPLAGNNVIGSGFIKGATSGTMTMDLQWCRNTTSHSITLGEGSWVKLTRLG